MPSLNQDFTRLEHDSFVLQYSPTDGTISSNDWSFWWGLSDNNTSTPTSNLLIESWRVDASGDFSNGVYDNTTDCSSTATQLANTFPSPAPTTAPFFLQGRINTTGPYILLQYGIFKELSVGEYYHELVLMPIILNTTPTPNEPTAYQCRSHVAATGILTVTNSTFTNRTYR